MRCATNQPSTFVVFGKWRRIVCCLFFVMVLSLVNGFLPLAAGAKGSFSVRSFRNINGVKYRATTVSLSCSGQFIPDHINNRSEIVGHLVRHHNIFGQVVISSTGAFRNVTSGDNYFDVAFNGNDEILLRPTTTHYKAAIWRNDFLTFVHLIPFAFNKYSQTVGLGLSGEHQHFVALLWDHGHIIDISDPAHTIAPVAINDSGEILGVDHNGATGLGTLASIGVYLRTAQSTWRKVHQIVNQDKRAELSPGKMLLNNNGDILISYSVLSLKKLSLQAALWKNGKYYSLGNNRDVRVSAMNNSGDAVGQVWSDSLQDWIPFLYRGGHRYELNKLLSNSGFAKIDEAVDINDIGQIIGLGHYYGLERTVLLNRIQDGL